MAKGRRVKGVKLLVVRSVAGRLGSDRRIIEEDADVLALATLVRLLRFLIPEADAAKETIRGLFSEAE
jgi:hypothetical protein